MIRVCRVGYSFLFIFVCWIIVVESSWNVGCIFCFLVWFDIVGWEGGIDYVKLLSILLVWYR